MRPGLTGPGGWLRGHVGRRGESPVTLGYLLGSWDGLAVQQEDTLWMGIGRSNSKCLQGLEGVLEDVCGLLAQR